MYVYGKTQFHVEINSQLPSKRPKHSPDFTHLLKFYTIHTNRSLRMRGIKIAMGIIQIILLQLG